MNILNLNEISQKIEIEKLKLFNFKSYEVDTFEFHPQLNIITGLNGTGKTNLLDAIYYLCITKSFFQAQDSFLVKTGSGFFRAEGYFRKNEKNEKLVVKYNLKEKVFEKNNVPYEKMSEHIGQFPVVFIVPDDVWEVNTGSAERRKFIDNTLSQIDPVYLDNLILYNKILRQKTGLLKNTASNRAIDADLVEYYNRQMCQPGAVIHEKRTALVERLNQYFIEYYRVISEDKESVSIQYKSQLNDHPIQQLFADQLRDEILMRKSTCGIHKDDITLKINGLALKKFASQGQMKSVIMALKMAQFDLISVSLGIKPLLLLDDIFDKLDEKRVASIVRLIVNNRFGQVFVTDTYGNRFEKLLEGNNFHYKAFELSSRSMAENITL